MRTIQAPAVPEIDIETVLGEGPLWEAASETLHFVDVGSNVVFHYHYPSKTLTADYYDGCIASIALRKSEPGFIAATERGWAFLDPSPGPSSPSSPLPLVCFANPLPDELPASRMMNDSGVDSEGRIISGVKTRRGDPFNEHLKPGTFWRLGKGSDGEWAMDQIADGMTVPNGVGLNAKGDMLYLNDTRAPHVLAYDYEARTGAVTNERVFAKTEYLGRPDGLCFDTEDCIWVAKFAGSKVTRYRPDGTIDLEVVFPTAHNITAPMFGGKDMNILFVTSLSLQESGEDTPEMRQRYPHCGAVFAVEIPGVTGVDKRRFGW